MADVPGWQNLTDGHIVSAAYNALNIPLQGYLIFIFFVVVSYVLYKRTESIEVPFVLGLLFLATFGIGGWLNGPGLSLTIAVLAFELAGLLYKVMFKP